MFSGIVLISIPAIYFKHLSSKNKGIEQPTNWLYLPETKEIILEDIRYLYTQKSDEPNTK